jgi:hypothetical protein
MAHGARIGIWHQPMPFTIHVLLKMQLLQMGVLLALLQMEVLSPDLRSYVHRTHRSVLILNDFFLFSPRPV